MDYVYPCVGVADVSGCTDGCRYIHVLVWLILVVVLMRNAYPGVGVLSIVLLLMVVKYTLVLVWLLG